VESQARLQEAAGFRLILLQLLTISLTRWTVILLQGTKYVVFTRDFTQKKARDAYAT